jgi:hypothetical protein
MAIKSGYCLAQTLGEGQEIGEIHYINGNIHINMFFGNFGVPLPFTIPRTHISGEGWAAHLLDGRDGFHLQLGNLSQLFHELDVPGYSVARHTCVLSLYV